MTPALYGAAIFAAAFGGGLIPLFWKLGAGNPFRLTLSFGAGLLLGMAFLHMVPEAAELAPESFGYGFAGGFVLLLILERFVMVHACEETECHYHTVGVAAFAGLTVHGLLEGFALGSTLFVSDLAPLVLIAILAHKVPAGFTLTFLLQLASRTRKQIILFTLGVALSGPVGLGLSLGLLQQENLPWVSGTLLALSAGSFLYIGACDLLPEVHRGNTEKKIPGLVSFLFGLLLSALSGFVI